MTTDLIIVGGGLSGGLLAHRLAERHPKLRLRLLEAGPTLGGNHTWSFHDTDLTPAQRAWLAPFIAHHWPGHDVAFEGFTRAFATGYAAITSHCFDSTLRASLGEAVQCDTPVTAIARGQVRLSDGSLLHAAAVIDARGYQRPTRPGPLAWQNFFGQELRFTAPHGLTRPLLMDATVTQLGGFRFVYVLPFAADTALVEDTYYADEPGVDQALLRGRIADYLAAKGWQVADLIREEAGSLPIPLAATPPAIPGPVPTIGMRAGLAHPTTGYSLAEAVRLADRIAALPSLSADSIAAAIDTHLKRAAARQGFFRLVNRMLFLAAAPTDRHRAMRRFYQLPNRVIAHFYAGQVDAADIARILIGRPPVPFFAGLRAAFGDGTAPTVPIPQAGE